MTQTRRAVLKLAALMSASVGTEVLSAEPTTTPAPEAEKKGLTARKYAISTLEAVPGKDQEFHLVLAATESIALRHGITVQKAFDCALGQSRKKVTIWEGPTYAALATAFDDDEFKELRDRMNALGPASVDFAAWITGTGYLKNDSKSAVSAMTIGESLDLRPGQLHAYLDKVLSRQTHLAKSYQVWLTASYHVEVGRRGRLLNFWSAPTVGAWLKAAADPQLHSPRIESDYASAVMAHYAELYVPISGT
jgi:hypothetical protein